MLGEPLSVVVKATGLWGRLWELKGGQVGVCPVSRSEVHVRIHLWSNVASGDFLFFFVGHDALSCFVAGAGAAVCMPGCASLCWPGRTRTPQLRSPHLLIWMLEDEQQEISTRKLRGKERNKKESAETHGAQ